MPSIPRRKFLERSAGAAAALAAAQALRPHLAPAAEAAKLAKVGQIGTAHSHAADKMSAFRKLTDDYDVVGVVEPDAVLRAQAEKNPAYKDVCWLTEEQLLATPDLQVVAVETAVRDQASTAARCIAAGKHVHFEKPGGESPSAFKKLLGDAEQRRLCIQMGYMLRHNPAFQFLFRAAREGWLGQIFEVHGTMSKAVGAPQRREFAEYAGGAMFELGCHLIDPLVALLGKPDRVTPYIRRTRAPSDELADNQLAVFEYPQCTATVRAAVVEVQGGKRRQFVVCGTEGTIDIRPLEPPQMQLALSKPRDRFRAEYQTVELPPMAGRYDEQLKELARVVRGEQEPSFGYAHDLAVHQAVLSASLEITQIPE